MLPGDMNSEWVDLSLWIQTVMSRQRSGSVKVNIWLLDLTTVHPTCSVSGWIFQNPFESFHWYPVHSAPQDSLLLLQALPEAHVSAPQMQFTSWMKRLLSVRPLCLMCVLWPRTSGIPWVFAILIYTAPREAWPWGITHIQVHGGGWSHGTSYMIYTSISSKRIPSNYIDTAHFRSLDTKCMGTLISTSFYFPLWSQCRPAVKKC